MATKRLSIGPINLGGAGAPADETPHPVETFTNDEGLIINIPVDAIRPNPDQPRKYFDPQALEDLTESIRERGVLQPIIVRRDADGFVLIAGERRWRATTRSGRTKIPALIRQKEDPAEIALIENLQREDLNPIEEAESLRRLKESRGLTDEALARIIGKSRASVTESMSLNRLPEVIAAECRTSDNWSKSQLLQVIRQPNEEQQVALWKAIRDGNLSVKATRQVTKLAATSRRKPALWSYQPKERTFSVRVTFRKTKASPDEIKDALRAALKNVS